ncbi:MAG: DNA-binding response regulator [Bacteroidales bacterium]|nr:DNA-binding response regulator [Bacteroidales bacterium]
MKKTLLDILIIDDDLINVKSIEKILLDDGFKNIRSATRYDKAQKMIEEQKPDLILCDIHLHYEKDGIDLMTEINQKHTIPFIYLTSYTDKVTLDRAKNSKPFSYITKPFTDKQVTSSIYLLISDNLQQKNNVQISERELDIIKYLSKGLSSKEVGEVLNIAFHTVETHRKRILKKIDVKNTTELIYYAVKNNLI